MMQTIGDLEWECRSKPPRVASVPLKSDEVWNDRMMIAWDLTWVFLVPPASHFTFQMFYSGLSSIITLHALIILPK